MREQDNTRVRACHLLYPKSPTMPYILISWCACNNGLHRHGFGWIIVMAYKFILPGSRANNRGKLIEW